jgi:hypothetical protein
VFVPNCFKETTIIPVPKKNQVTCPNDYCPVALTTDMKCFERLVIAHIKDSMPVTQDLLQFSYRSNISTEDTISIAIHMAITHLDKRNTYMRMLFIG